MRIRRAVVTTAAVAVAAAILLALAACSAEPPPRTRPNAVELDALARAGNEFQSSTGRLEWRQLWTYDQAGGVIQNCVDRSGDGTVQVDVQVGPNGLGWGFTSSTAAATDDAAREAEIRQIQQLVDRCAASTPIDDRANRTRRADWDTLYSYDVTVLRRCLLAHGQYVPPAPTRDRFSDLLTAGTPWSPYDDVIVDSRAEWYALSDACPALPAHLAAAL